MSEVGDLFRAMAERIERNPENEFAGAILIVPPIDPGSGKKLEPIEYLAIAPKADLANFWATAMGKCDIAKALFDQQQLSRNPQAMFGR